MARLVFLPPALILLAACAGGSDSSPPKATPTRAPAIAFHTPTPSPTPTPPPFASPEDVPPLTLDDIVGIRNDVWDQIVEAILAHRKVLYAA